MSKPFTSSIGRKLVMSITGTFLFLFLLFHMCMNLVALFSAEAYNMICEFLGANWYALAGTLVIAAGVAVHFIYAFILTLKNMKARGDQAYAVSKQPRGVSWASRNMFVLGVIIVLGLGLHLYNFWYNMQYAEIIGNHELGKFAPTDGAAYIADLFSQPLYCVVYLIWFAAIWFHLTHGLWSAMQTVGWENKVWIKRVKCIANMVATLVCLGFAAVVVVFFLRGYCSFCI